MYTYKKLIRELILPCLIIFPFFGCSTLGGDLVLSTRTQSDFQKLLQYENSICISVIEGKAIDEALFAELLSLQKEPWVNKTYRAKILGLIGASYLTKNDTKRAQAYAKEALAIYSDDINAKTITILVTSTDVLKIRDLLALLESDGFSIYPLCITATLAFNNADFKTAAACFEDAYTLASPKLQIALSEKRDISRRLLDSGSISAESVKFFEITQMKFDDCISWLITKPELWEYVSITASDSKPIVIKKIIEAGIFPDTFDITNGTLLLTRKDVARFFWVLYSKIKKDTTLLTKYTTKYSSRIHAGTFISPLLDVPYNHKEFDAILGVLEKGIMELPNGKQFFPDGIVPGTVFIEAGKLFIDIIAKKQ